MSATVIREKRQTTLPVDVVEAAGLKVKRFYGGGLNKLEPQDVEDMPILGYCRLAISRNWSLDFGIWDFFPLFPSLRIFAKFTDCLVAKFSVREQRIYQDWRRA